MYLKLYSWLSSFLTGEAGHAWAPERGYILLQLFEMQSSESSISSCAYCVASTSMCHVHIVQHPHLCGMFTLYSTHIYVLCSHCTAPTSMCHVLTPTSVSHVHIVQHPHLSVNLFITAPTSVCHVHTAQHPHPCAVCILFSSHIHVHMCAHCSAPTSVCRVHTVQHPHFCAMHAKFDLDLLCQCFLSPELRS